MTLEELAEDIITRRPGEILTHHDYQHELRKRGLPERDANRLADLCDAYADASESTQTFRSH